VIFDWFKKRRRRALLAEPPGKGWFAHLDTNLAYWRHLDDGQRSRLLDIARVIEAEKDWRPGGDFELTDEVRHTVAAQAALLLLGLKHDHYRNVETVVIYPASYQLPRHRAETPELAAAPTPVLGHARYGGPVVLSWRHARAGGRNGEDGQNLVYHEFAHKLDMLDGTVDGTPILRTRLAYRRWHKVMSAEFEALRARTARGRRGIIDTYGATDVGEFFAVITEAFFERPVALRARHPRLYGRLRRFYGQDPAEVLG
jgi:hypothetical protein